MTEFRVHKVTALPSVLQQHAMYLIAPAANPELLEIVVTNADASSPHRRVINKSDVEGMISNALSESNTLTIVADISERNGLLPLNRAKWVYVQDASADPTVNSGGATYLYNPSTSSWIKTSEAESLDITLNWADIVGRPNSTPAQIDSAVSNSHTHMNKTELDKIGQDANGNLTYDGKLPVTGWTSIEW